MYTMQARSSADSALYTWPANTKDFTGAGWVAKGFPGSPLEIAVASDPVDSTGPIIPAVLSLAGGAIGWFDFDAKYSGTAIDSNPLTTFINRIVGSDAVLAPVAGGTSSVYKTSAWRTSRPQGCAQLLDAALRATGTSVTGMCNGLAKNHTWILVWRPGITTRTTQYAAGFDKLGAASFSKCCSQLRKTSGGGMFWHALSQASDIATDTALINQTAQILQVSRLNGNQLRIGINNVHTAPISYGSGITYDLDGWTIGGHISSLISGDALYRAAFLFNHDIGATGTENTELYRYLTAEYSGFENIASLGAA